MVFKRFHYVTRSVFYEDFCLAGVVFGTEQHHAAVYAGAPAYGVYLADFPACLFREYSTGTVFCDKEIGGALCAGDLHVYFSLLTIAGYFFSAEGRTVRPSYPTSQVHFHISLGSINFAPAYSYKAIAL